MSAGGFVIRSKAPQIQVYIFFFNDTATTEIYTLSLHDALPISLIPVSRISTWVCCSSMEGAGRWIGHRSRSEEHTSELQSQSNLVCRLLLEKKNRISSVFNSCSLTNIHAT